MRSQLIQLKMIPCKGLYVDVLFMSHALILSYFPRKSTQHISPKHASTCTAFAKDCFRGKGGRSERQQPWNMRDDNHHDSHGLRKPAVESFPRLLVPYLSTYPFGSLLRFSEWFLAAMSQDPEPLLRHIPESQ
ncbi:hypothetical protein MAP00_009275 [Monascus purpureus]|nr:hypothetical protein MAP00_009275 [Monascus purpureus]